MTGYLIDTSVLIGQYKGEIPRSKLEKLTEFSGAISTITVYEMNKYLRNNGKLQDWNEIKQMLTKHTTIEPSFEICELAGELSNSKRLSTADAIIYATALQNNLRFLTRDSDFAKLEKAQII